MYGIEAHEKRCDIIERKKYIVFIFNLFGIPFSKNDSFNDHVKNFNTEKEVNLEKGVYK